MHLFTKEAFLPASSVEAMDDRLEEAVDLEEMVRLEVSSLLPPNSLPMADNRLHSSSIPLSSSAIGLLSHGMLLSLRLGGRSSPLCCCCCCASCCPGCCCCCKYCSQDDTTSVAVSESRVATVLESKPVSRLREREGGSDRRIGRGRRGEPAPSPLLAEPRTGSRGTGLAALPQSLRGEADRGLLVVNNLLCLTSAGSPRQSLAKSLSEHEEPFPLSVLVVRWYGGGALGRVDGVPGVAMPPSALPLT